jgi:hypothetical protein
MTEGGAATLVWAHIIAFDLFVGRWIYLQGTSDGIHPLVMAPILIVTILFAPIGFLAFVTVRAARKSTREGLRVDVGSRP